MKVTAAQLRQMRRDNLKYPAHLIDVPREEWPATGNGCGATRIRLMRSRTFLVQVFQQGLHVRLSVNRCDWDDRAKRFRADISWDELQRLKREAGYGEQCAVELFPPDAAVVNVANMRHLFITPCPAFMW